ncbi:MULTISPECIES: hypothetical protein [unclassified Polaribacter]|uniref:hypothetical protein n=1 Tax=unclassified Polaribacter TaxID=196858 RepID=UPI0011BF93A5|nr:MULTISPECIES: hypothetical protein [unclassified Polaribacter]TXD52824.1 hypothetical protein ES043_07265 [Polaribacter sp. IC063]TXD61701.1 hypothetical protein ES044_04225 [Polaribacter sp. IC066]
MKHILTFLTIFLLFSCDKKQEKDEQAQDDFKPLLSIVNEYSAIKEIDTVFNKDVENWEELRTVDDFLSRFKKVSPNEILSNAIELKDLVKSLTDSLHPQLFNTASFNARINILYNETLRLADMTTIPLINADEVNEQAEKIIDAFSAVNSKVNSILAKKRFEEAIEVDVKFIGLDSTKLDSVSKKSVKRELLQRPSN